MKMPGFVAESSLRSQRTRWQNGHAPPAESTAQAVEPSYRCSLYQVAKCLINGESDCWDRFCPIVQ